MSHAIIKSLPIVAVLGAIAAVMLFTASTSAQSSEARLRVLHASPDAPAVDVYLDDAEAISELAFESITDYVAVPAGDHNVKVFAASANGTGEPVIDADVTLTAGADYTVAAVGTLSEIEPLVLQDDNSAPATGQAKLRVVHASPDAPNVDVFAAGAGVVVPDLPFKEASGYLALGAGSYDIEVRAAGTETVAIDLPGVALEAGNVYTAFAIGLLEGQPALEAKLTVDAAQAQPSANTAAPTAAPATTPAPGVGGLPSAGGPLGDEGSGISLWLVAGLVLAAAGIVTGSFALATNTRKNG